MAIADLPARYDREHAARSRVLRPGPPLGAGRPRLDLAKAEELLSTGHPPAEVAKATGPSHRTVGRIKDKMDQRIAERRHLARLPPIDYGSREPDPASAPSRL